MNPFFIIQYIILAINIDWGDIIDPIGRIFTGGNFTAYDGTTQYATGIFEGDPMLMGAFLLLIFLILTFIFGLGMLVGSVVIIPSLFAIFQYIPDLRIIVGIISGLIFGLALHKLIRR